MKKGRQDRIAETLTPKQALQEATKRVKGKIAPKTE